MTGPTGAPDTVSHATIPADLTKRVRVGFHCQDGHRRNLKALAALDGYDSLEEWLYMLTAREVERRRAEGVDFHSAGR
jgi:hypothetical protein